MMLVYLVYYCVSAINMIPRAGKQESPRELFKGEKIDFSRDCKLQWGSYVQVHDDNDITNDMTSRTTGAICLGPAGNAQGAYRFLSLVTWKIIQRRSWTELPIPNDVIIAINAHVTKEKVVEQAVEVGGTETQAARRGRKKKKIETIIEEIPPKIINNEATAPIIQDEVNGNVVNGVDTLARIAEAIKDFFVDENEADDFDDQELVNMTDHVVLAAMHGFILPVEDMYEATALTSMTIRRGIKEYGERAMNSMFEEFNQLIEKKVFEPVVKEQLTPGQLKTIMRSLMFMKVKRDGRLKSRFCADGSIQSEFLDVSEWSSPTVLTDAMIMTAIIEAFERRYVKVADIEGAYLAANMEGDNFIELDETTTAAVLQIRPEWKRFVLPNGRLVVRLRQALYGCVQSAKLFYEHVSGVLQGFGFIANPYEKCVFNKDYKGVQCTVTLYVDDLKISCKDPQGVEEVLDELRRVYKTITVKEGKVLDYLGMKLDYSKDGVVSIGMGGLIDEVFEDLPVDNKVKDATSPAISNLFSVNPNSEKLNQLGKEKFHSLVAKLLYIAKRGRPDILTAVSFLTTRVSQPDVDDQKKLERLVSYMHGTKDMVLTLGAKDLEELHAYVDASHAIHPDAKSHTGLAVTLGMGSFMTRSSKQKIVAKSSTVAELIGVSDALDHVIWAKEFLSCQGIHMKPIVLHQDNQSTIILCEKGRSNSQRTRHVNIRYFGIKDLIDRGEIRVVYTGTESMIADYFTKPLQGKLFLSARYKLMGLPASDTLSQGCVSEQED